MKYCGKTCLFSADKSVWCWPVASDWLCVMVVGPIFDSLLTGISWQTAILQISKAYWSTIFGLLVTTPVLSFWNPTFSSTICPMSLSCLLFGPWTFHVMKYSRLDCKLSMNVVTNTINLPRKCEAESRKTGLISCWAIQTIFLNHDALSCQAF